MLVSLGCLIDLCSLAQLGLTRLVRRRCKALSESVKNLEYGPEHFTAGLLHLFSYYIRWCWCGASRLDPVNITAIWHASAHNLNRSTHVYSSILALYSIRLLITKHLN